MDWWAWWIGFSASGNFCSVVVAALKNLDHERAAIIHHRGEAGTWIRVSSAGATSRVTYAFHGLFGIGSNEIIMVTSWGLDHDPVAELSLPDNVERVEEVVLVPTIRPAGDQQLSVRGSTYSVSSMCAMPMWKKSQSSPKRRGPRSKIPASTLPSLRDFSVRKIERANGA